MTETCDEMIGFHQVLGLTGIGPARLSLLVRSGLFPARKSFAGWRWSKAEVLEWIRAHPAQDALREQLPRRCGRSQRDSAALHKAKPQLLLEVCQQHWVPVYEHLMRIGRRNFFSDKREGKAGLCGLNICSRADGWKVA